jgi:hypothetical protein
MPIDTRPPDTEMGVSRSGGAVTTGIAAPPPGVLLPSGDRPAPVVTVPTTSAATPWTTPQRALALDAVRLLRRIQDPARRPDRWHDEDVARDITRVRRHLAPLRTRRALAASFTREAFHHRPPADADQDPGPVRLAYAIRWLELGDGVDRPAWPRLVASPRDGA